MRDKQSVTGGGFAVPAGFSILAYADLHYVSEEEKELMRHPPASDVVVLLGDISKQSAELIADAAKETNTPVLYILGNHDDRGQYKLVDGVRNADGQLLEVDGVLFAGMSGGPRYKRGTQFMRTQEEASYVLSSLPPCNILLTHEGPYHMFRQDVPHEGFAGIDEYLKEKKPSLHLFGHQHVRASGKIYETQYVCVYRCSLITVIDGKVIEKHMF